MFSDILKRYGHYLESATRAAPIIQYRRKKHAPSVIRWDGVIVGREWPVDMPEDELALLRVAGNRERLRDAMDASPGVTPVVTLTEWEKREAKRLMDRHCLNGFETHNVACNAGRTNLLYFLSYATVGGNPGYTGIVAFGVGTGTGTPNAQDTALFGSNEVFRKALTLTTISGNQIDASTSFAATEGNYTYGDAGIFGSVSGNVASTTTVNTGILYAHASYVYTKSTSVALSNDYYISMN